MLRLRLPIHSPFTILHSPFPMLSWLVVVWVTATLFGNCATVLTTTLQFNLITMMKNTLLFDIKYLHFKPIHIHLTNDSFTHTLTQTHSTLMLVCHRNQKEVPKFNWLCSFCFSCMLHCSIHNFYTGQSLHSPQWLVCNENSKTFLQEIHPCTGFFIKTELIFILSTRVYMRITYILD